MNGVNFRVCVVDKGRWAAEGAVYLFLVAGEEGVDSAGEITQNILFPKYG